VDGDATAADCDGHGTHVGATAIGRGVGVAKSATLVAVRVLDCSGSGTISDTVAGGQRGGWVEGNRCLGGTGSVCVQKEPSTGQQPTAAGARITTAFLLSVCPSRSVHEHDSTCHVCAIHHSQPIVLLPCTPGIEWVAQHRQLPAVAIMSLGVSSGDWSATLEASTRSLINDIGIPAVVASGEPAANPC
jgi:subtilisin family serine protease